MKSEAFDELLESVRQAGKIRRGRAKPSRVSTFKPADVKKVNAVTLTGDGSGTPWGPA